MQKEAPSPIELIRGSGRWGSALNTRTFVIAFEIDPDAASVKPAWGGGLYGRSASRFIARPFGLYPSSKQAGAAVQTAMFGVSSGSSYNVSASDAATASLTPRRTKRLRDTS